MLCDSVAPRMGLLRTRAWRAMLLMPIRAPSLTAAFAADDIA